MVDSFHQLRLNYDHFDNWSDLLCVMLLLKHSGSLQVLV